MGVNDRGGSRSRCPSGSRTLVASAAWVHGVGGVRQGLRLVLKGTIQVKQPLETPGEGFGGCPASVSPPPPCCPQRLELVSTALSTRESGQFVFLSHVARRRRGFTSGPRGADTVMVAQDGDGRSGVTCLLPQA